MLSWSLVLFILAVVAGVFGFDGISEGLAEIGQLLFFFFIMIFAASVIGRLVTGRRPLPV